MTRLIMSNSATRISSGLPFKLAGARSVSISKDGWISLANQYMNHTAPGRDGIRHHGNISAMNPLHSPREKESERGGKGGSLQVGVKWNSHGRQIVGICTVKKNVVWKISVMRSLCFASETKSAGRDFAHGSQSPYVGYVNEGNVAMRRIKRCNRGHQAFSRLKSPLKFDLNLCQSRGFFKEP
jgi:hypothetical protein